MLYKIPTFSEKEESLSVHGFFNTSSFIMVTASMILSITVRFFVTSLNISFSTLNNAGLASLMVCLRCFCSNKIYCFQQPLGSRRILRKLSPKEDTIIVVAPILLTFLLLRKVTSELVCEYLLVHKNSKIILLMFTMFLLLFQNTQLNRPPKSLTPLQ